MPRRNLRKRRRVIEVLERRLMLAAEIFKVGSTNDVSYRSNPSEPYTLREAIYLANRSTADDVVINLLPNQTHAIQRPTNGFDSFNNFRFSEQELGGIFDEEMGDLDIRRDMMIDGQGATIDANSLGRIFEITDGADVTFQNLTLREGLAPVVESDSDDVARGGAIRAHDGSHIGLVGVEFVDNQAVGSDGSSGNAGKSGLGGAIHIVNGTIHINRSTFTNNLASGGDGETDQPSDSVDDGTDGGTGQGGAIYGENTDIVIGFVANQRTSFDGNRTRGGGGGDGADTGGRGGNAAGGAVYLRGGSFDAEGTDFASNQSRAGRGGDGETENGGDGGNARGGAIYVIRNQAVDGSLSVRDSNFDDNQATGETGGNGGTDVSKVAGGDGGVAEGGAIYSGDRVTTDLLRTTFETSTASGGRGGLGADDKISGRGGDARGGAVYSAGQLDLELVSVSENVATAGDAAPYQNRSESNRGGDAAGGGIYATWDPNYFNLLRSVYGSQVDAWEAASTATPAITLTDVDLSMNVVSGGDGGSGYDDELSELPSGATRDGGDAVGGGLFVADTIGQFDASEVTVTGNLATGGDGGNMFEQNTAGYGGDAFGGGMFVGAAKTDFFNVTVTDNRVHGGDGGDTPLGRAGDGGQARGGGIATASGVELTITGTVETIEPVRSEEDYVIHSSISNNFAIGGDGGEKSAVTSSSSEDQAGDGGSVRGGGLYMDNDGLLAISNSMLRFNGGFAGRGGHGDANLGETIGGELVVGSAGGDSGSVRGGGIYSLSDTAFVDSSLLQNQASAGRYVDGTPLSGGPGGFDEDGQGLPGGRGGSARGGGIYMDNADLLFDSSVTTLNIAQGGHGGAGGLGVSGLDGDGGFGGGTGLAGSAFGGGIAVDSTFGATVMVNQSQVLSNLALGGRGGNGANGANRRAEDDGVQDQDGGSGGDGGGRRRRAAEFGWCRPLVI
ncbi:MAG: hypothetical protein R3C05_02845 [Pirellulaceae bacterium]